MRYKPNRIKRNKNMNFSILNDKTIKICNSSNLTKSIILGNIKKKRIKSPKLPCLFFILRNFVSVLWGRIGFDSDSGSRVSACRALRCSSLISCLKL